MYVLIPQNSFDQARKLDFPPFFPLLSFFFYHRTPFPHIAVYNRISPPHMLWCAVEHVCTIFASARATFNFTHSILFRFCSQHTHTKWPTDSFCHSDWDWIRSKINELVPYMRVYYVHKKLGDFSSFSSSSARHHSSFLSL